MRTEPDDPAGREPPTPAGVPVLGNGLAFSRDPVGAMEEWASLGDVVRLVVPGRTMYLVTGPAQIERVLLTDADAFEISTAQQETFQGVEDHAVTTTTGERWERLRNAMDPALAGDAVRGYADRMVQTTARYVDGWHDGTRIDLSREMRRLAVTVLADALLDVDIRGREAIVMDAADALVDRANLRRPGQLLPDVVPTPTDRRFARTVSRLDDFVEEILAERRTDGRGEDICSVLLQAHEAGALTIAEVRHNLVALLLAGHDSPATALTHALRLVAETPGVKASVLAEIDGISEQSAREALPGLTRTDNVVSETLRLYPPTLGVTRQATEPVSLAGYDLPAGAEFLLPQWVVHRDERWWDDPEAFDPERWRESTERPAYAYFPFGGGPRTCLGARLARQELVLVLATVLDRVELDVTVDGPLTFTPSLQLRPEPDIEATVHRR